MKTAFIAAGLLIASTPAFAEYPTHAYAGRACHATLEEWIKKETHGGDRLQGSPLQFGAIIVAQVQWADGTVQEVTVGPEGGQFCTLAAKDLTRVATQ